MHTPCSDISPTVVRITKRPVYLAVARSGRKWVTTSFILQALPSKKDDHVAIGYTVSKKVGNAVRRSKVKRRLKEASRLVFAEHAKEGWRYVLIGREAAFTYDFEKIQADMKWALAKLSAGADLREKQSPKHKKR